MSRQFGTARLCHSKIARSVFVVVSCNRLLQSMVFNAILGGHKENQSPTTEHQRTLERNPNHEGQEEPQYSYLFRQVSSSGIIM